MTATTDLELERIRLAERRPWLGRERAWVIVLVALTMLGTLWVTRLPNISGDTGPLLAGSDTMARCLLDGPRVGCGTFSDGTQTLVGPFPLLQHIPDLTFKALGLTHHSRTVGLSLLSIAAFAGMLGVAHRTLRRIGQPAWWPGFLVISLTSPLLYYGNSTWGEMLAAFLLLAFTSSTLVLDRPSVVAALAFAAALTKETAFPLLLALGLFGLLLARRRTGLTIRRQLVATAAGVAAGVAVSSAFNIFRFDSPFNEYYLQSKFRVEELSQRAEYFAGLFVAPNAGVLLYWTSACALLLFAIALPLILRARGRPSAVWPAIALGAIAVALTASLATWWMPYGWHAWGPRLTLPWIPSLLILAIGAYGRPAGSFVAGAIRSNVGLAIVAALLLIPALPQIGYPLAHPTIYALFFQPDERCPATITLETIETPAGLDEYYSCIRYRSWEKSPVLVDALRVIRSVPGAAFAAAWALALVALLYLMRLALSRGVTPVVARGP